MLAQAAAVPSNLGGVTQVLGPVPYYSARETYAAQIFEFVCRQAANLGDEYRLYPRLPF